MIHELPLAAAYLHGHFSRGLPPVVSVDPGDSVRFSVPDAGWRLATGETLAPLRPSIDTGHPLAGPIEVRGARAGQVLAVRVDAVEPARAGVTLTEEPHLVEWELEGDVGRGAGFEVTLAPFFGVLGMPPPDAGIHSTIPPRASGGNIDCKELVAGSTLLLPIPVDGALFSVGDGHAAQGDGEVSGTAIECAASGSVMLSLRDDLELEWPIARTDTAWVAFGFAVDLDAASRIALDGMLDLMVRNLEIGRQDALALASVVVDLRITQVVNEMVGVHAVLRDDALRRVDPNE